MCIYSLFWLSCLDVDYKGSLFWKRKTHNSTPWGHMSKTSDLSFPLTCQAIYQVGCLQRRRRSFTRRTIWKMNAIKKKKWWKMNDVESFFPFPGRRQLNSTRVAAHRWQEPTNNFTCPIFCVRSINTDTCAYAIGDVLEEKETNWIRGIQFLRNDMNKIPRNTKKIMNFFF